jgi:hypothetical protein
LGKGSQEERLLSLIKSLRHVSGVHEVNSAPMDGSAESKPEQYLTEHISIHLNSEKAHSANFAHRSTS